MYVFLLLMFSGILARKPAQMTWVEISYTVKKVSVSRLVQSGNYFILRLCMTP